MLSTIKFLSVVGVAGWMLFGSHAARAQIPVTDGASIAQSVAQQVETIAKWKLQYDQMVSQIDQAKQQYESLTGSRGLGNIMNDPALRGERYLSTQDITMHRQGVPEALQGVSSFSVQ